MKKMILIPIIAAVISGCSTSAVDPGVARSVPPERVFLLNSNEDKTGEITVIRDSGAISSMCFVTLFIDGKPVADLDTSEKVVFNVKEGEHIIGTAFMGRGLCSSGEKRQERDFRINAGDVKYYRIFTDQSGNTDVRPTTLD
ncbi:hypothetical protein ABM000_16880 [Morganella morganii]|uniref:hypothetical protein n=1 Tax=Morganella TaxID=581 RepID=UPI0008D593D1|nr:MULTISPECIES: hypothetical protein [Morganella]AUR31934.1 hypothetical protein C1O70_10730 [Morganella morganii]EKW8501439.1 hypothetical protein [Morganella morganii]MBC3974234.1 hypothetical protein [Morganella morganii]MBC3994444.1 hypothetical protein [Morganella morganii]MBC6659439.1 hypothetical protein [Morganella morganii]